MNPSRTPTEAPAPAWWRLPIVWMVIGGPAAVVVASFVTLALAIRHPDPVLTESAAAPRSPGSQLPAMQARNHAATPQR
jgi:hypothetical protein